MAVLIAIATTAYSKKGDWDHAIADFTKAIGLDPKPGLYDGRGDAYLGKGDTDHAIADYNKAIGLYSQAIRLDAKSADLWNGRCSARAKTGHLQQALSDCNQSLDLEPNSAEIRVALLST
jgi:tetratricopeptide (TPR) repeat protein